MQLDRQVVLWADWFNARPGQLDRVARAHKVTQAQPATTGDTGPTGATGPTGSAGGVAVDNSFGSGLDSNYLFAGGVTGTTDWSLLSETWVSANVPVGGYYTLTTVFAELSSGTGPTGPTGHWANRDTIHHVYPMLPRERHKYLVPNNDRCDTHNLRPTYPSIQYDNRHARHASLHRGSL